MTKLWPLQLKKCANGPKGTKMVKLDMADPKNKVLYEEYNALIPEFLRLYMSGVEISEKRGERFIQLLGYFHSEFRGLDWESPY